MVRKKPKEIIEGVDNAHVENGWVKFRGEEPIVVGENGDEESLTWLNGKLMICINRKELVIP